MDKSSNYSRDKHLDFYKNIAFINMALYHFIFNLQNFNLINYNIFTDIYGIIWRAFILGTFLICVGISLVIVNNNPTSRKKPFYKKSTFLLFIASFLVTLGSYFIFPDSWIFFGVIHFIFVSKILLIPFVNRAKLSLVLGVSIILGYLYFGAYNPFLSFYGVGILPIKTLDMINIVPWVGIVLIGIFLGHYPFYKKLPFSHNRSLNIISKNSLLFYLLHQIILFPIVWFISFILGAFQ